MAKDILIQQPFLGGDFNVGESAEQHIHHVVLSNPGHFKNAPLLGVSIIDLMNAPLSPAVVADIERVIRLQLEADGAKEIKVSIDPTTQKFYINGKYD